MIKYEIIGSGSEGNALLINGELLIDCGVPYNKLTPYIKDLKFVLVTHQHGDHFNLATIKKIKYERPLVEILMNADIDTSEFNFKVHPLYADKMMIVGGYLITPQKLYHNVSNLAFIIKHSSGKLFYGTDTFEVKHISKAQGLDFYFLEMNFDENIMEDMIDREVRSSDIGFAHYEESQFNHLSFQKAWKWFSENRNTDSRLIPLHVSSKLVGSLLEYLKSQDPDLISF